MSDHQTHTSPVVTELHHLARQTFGAKGRALHDAAEDIAHKAELWFAAVDDKLDDWGNKALHEASQAAFNSYREAVVRGRSMLAEFKA